MENHGLGYATPLEIHYISKPELDHPDMIAAWPGMGYIAKISADYLRRRLNAKLFAEVTYYHNMLVYNNGLGELVTDKTQVLCLIRKEPNNMRGRRAALDP